LLKIGLVPVDCLLLDLLVSWVHLLTASSIFLSSFAACNVSSPSLLVQYPNKTIEERSEL
jgi:hypothetical protein